MRAFPKEFDPLAFLRQAEKMIAMGFGLPAYLWAKVQDRRGIGRMRRQARHARMPKGKHTRRARG